MIDLATRDAQPERWDMSQILGEIQRLREAEASPTKVRSAELVAEELASRLDVGRQYVWNSDRARAETDLLSGIGLQIEGVEANDKVVVFLNWDKTVYSAQKNIGKWVKSVADKATAALGAAGWNAEVREASPRRLRLSATMHKSRVLRNLDGAAAALTKVAQMFEMT